LFRIILKGY